MTNSYIPSAAPAPALAPAPVLAAPPVWATPAPAPVYTPPASEQTVAPLLPSTLTAPPEVPAAPVIHRAAPEPAATPTAPVFTPSATPPETSRDSAERRAPDVDATTREFDAIIRGFATDGVSDIHFVGDDFAWPVKFGRPVKSNVSTPNNKILDWADVFAERRGGGAELEHGEQGSVETMAVIGPVGAQMRLRMTFRRQISGYGLTVRVVPEKPPRLNDAVFHENPVPPALVDLTLNSPAGLILFCGPTGSGKTTMNAGLLAEVNETQNRHIYTVEDPIEFVHASKMSMVTQREIGAHAHDFASALRTSLRSRPDVILVGELLDLETVRVAIEAANKGHLVFATSHASSAAEAVSSLVSQFPGAEQNQIATALSQALTAVVVQRLVPTLSNRLVPARELLLNTISISAKIRDGQYSALTQTLKLREGMYPFEDDLAMLWARGLISVEMAYKYTNDRKELAEKLRYAEENKDVVARGENRTQVGMNEILGRA